MKVLQINSTYKNGGSTGRIAYDLSLIMQNNKIENNVAYGIELGEGRFSNAICLQTRLELRISQLKSRIFAKHGFYNVSATRRLIKYIEELKPDIIHLHNIHGFYIHVGILFDYIKTHNIPIVWTLHDCWSFTGWCAYFDYSGCDRWKNYCYCCPSKKDYPKAWITARSTQNFKLKKKTFSGVRNLILITPSQWLANLTRYSFLKNYDVKVINNGVDINVFKPCGNDYKEKIGIKGKKMILAVAGGLAKRKGKDYLLKIPYLLNNDEILVILGINKDQIKLLPPNNCIGVPYTNAIHELAQIYSAADIFINTTLEDNFPTTNIEAMACGTPVVTFNTGGSCESVLDEEMVRIDNDIKITKVGGVVPKGDLNKMLYLIRYFLSKGKSVYVESCVEKVKMKYNKEYQYQIYLELYKDIITKNCC